MVNQSGLAIASLLFLGASCRTTTPPNVRESPAVASARPETRAADADASVTQSSGPVLEPVLPDAFAPDRITASLFELVIESGGDVLAADAALRRGLPRSPATEFAGTFPHAAWATVFFSAPDLVSGKSVFYRWKTDRWVAVDKAERVGSQALAFGAWTQDRMVVFFRDLRGQSSDSDSKPFVMDASGAIKPLPTAPKDFSGRKVESAKTGELIVLGRTSRDEGPSSVRPLVARFNAAADRVQVDALPTQPPNEHDTFRGTVHAQQLCVRSASSAVVVGERQGVDDAIASPAIWRFTSGDWQLELPRSDGWVEAIACTKDGSAWVGTGRILQRYGSLSESYALDDTAIGYQVFATDAGDVFLVTERSVWRLGR